MEYLSVVTVEEAWRVLERNLPAGPLGSETVPLTGGLGRVLAGDIISGVHVPDFSRSTVDGYAVKAEDTYGASELVPVFLRVIGEVQAGERASAALETGECVKIPTGGMMPGGADAVVMLEYTDPLEPQGIAVTRPVAPGENVVARGEDIREGDRLLAAGHGLRPQDIAALAGIGITQVRVSRRPVVAILSTGDEVVPPEAAPGPGQIRDMNSWSLSALVEEDGGQPLVLGIIPDDYSELRARVSGALSSSDMVLISGGSSVGTRDVTAEVIRSLGEPGVLVHGVALRPGKPTILGLVDGVPVYGVPGHPVSTMVVYRLFARPVLRRFLGLAPEPPWRGRIRAKLTRNVRSDAGREEYVRVALREGEAGTLAEPQLGKSAIISTMVKAHGLLRVPLGVEGLAQGCEVEVELF